MKSLRSRIPDPRNGIYNLRPNRLARGMHETDRATYSDLPHAATPPLPRPGSCPGGAYSAKEDHSMLSNTEALGEMVKAIAEQRENDAKVCDRLADEAEKTRDDYRSIEDDDEGYFAAAAHEFNVRAGALRDAAALIRR